MRITVVLMLTIASVLPASDSPEFVIRASGFALPPGGRDMGGPDGFGYYWESTQDLGDTIRFSWIDPSSHTVLTDWHPNSDDGWTGINLPFRFPFYGDTLDSIVVCSNGFLEFPTTFTSYENEQLPVPSIPGLIAVFWDDLSPAQSGSVRIWDDAAGRTTVVTWSDVVRFNTSDTLSVQVELSENGRIQMNILRAPSCSNSSTIGIQGHRGDNDHYLQYVFDGTPDHHLPVDSTSIRFFVHRLNHDVGVLRAGSPRGWIPANSQCPVAATFKNFGLNAETFQVTASVVRVRFPYDTAFTHSSHVSNLEPGDTIGCYFGDWLVPSSPDSWRAVFRSWLPGDEFAYNDSCRALTTTIPPAFGSVLNSWDFPELGDGMNLAGITFCADSNRFYLAVLDPNRVYSFPASGPESGLQAESVELQSFFGDDIIWGIAADPLTGSFWIGHVAANGPGCILARYAADGSFTGDTWSVGAIEPGVWFAGLDITPAGVCHATEVGASNRIYQLALGSKQVLGFLPGPVASWRACSYVGDRSCFLLSGGWNQNTLCRLSSSGDMLEAASLPGLADLDVYRRDPVYPDSLVWAFATLSNSANTIQQVSVGRVWSGVGLSDSPFIIHRSSFSVFPNPCRSRATVLLSSPVVNRQSSIVNLYDASGRLVLSVPARASSFVLSTSDLGAGIYLLTLSTPTGNLTRKLVVLAED